MSTIVYREARFPDDLRAVRDLFNEYAAAIGLNFCFQGFDEELAGLPGKYAPPDGSLWLAATTDAFAGCVAMRPLEPGVCELKRLYVRTEARGSGIGRVLANRVIEDARSAGYRVMRLDTLASMDAARSLYRSLEFVERTPYYDNPIPNVVFMERDL
ncbi:MAG: GNAT family N-acetyltransferase [Fimbriimonadaceae bacterium]|nr:GNAT family N-acetyltransferase [Fimbriimonadaceae bacterium]